MNNDAIRRYYSQYGEDYLIWEFFENKESGFFVDVGAFDGKHISNTYSFEQKGWEGICVEPNPDYFELCRVNRPGSHCVNAACGAESGTIVLNMDKTGLFSSTVDCGESKSLNQHYGVLKKEPELAATQVQMITLNSILEEIGVKEDQIDFVSIDVEGAELSVLDGFNLEKYKPRLLVMETSTEKSLEEITAYLIKRGYIYVRSNAANSYYVTSEGDAERLKGIVNICTIEKQMHPLGPEYTNPEYISGKCIYKGSNAVSKLREIDNIIKSYMCRSNDITNDVVADLKGFIEERKEKVASINGMLTNALQERNEKIASLNQIIEETKNERNSKVAALNEAIANLGEKHGNNMAKLTGMLEETKIERNEKVQAMTGKMQEMDSAYKERIALLKSKLIEAGEERNKAAEAVTALTARHKEELNRIYEENQKICKRTLSIITVVFNAKADLVKTIESIRSQQDVCFEFVVVDGGSTDGTLDVIKENSDIIDCYISERDNSIYEAMNKGLVLASGYYIQFLNAGDVFSSADALSRIYSELKKMEYHVVYGDINVYHGDKFICMNKAMEFNMDKLLKFGTGVLCHQAMFVRKDAAPLYNLKYRFKGELCWYFDICERLGDGLKYMHVEGPVVDYYLGGFGHKHFIKNRLDWIRLVRDKYGFKTIWEHKLLGFLYRNSFTRYPKLKKFDAIIKKLTLRSR